MVEIRRSNAALFVELFKDDDRFIIQRENGRSSWFSFTLILNPALRLDRARVMEALRKADIGFRMITGGCFLRHEAIKYFDYDTVGEIVQRQHRARPRLLRRQSPARSDEGDHAAARGARSGGAGVERGSRSAGLQPRGSGTASAFAPACHTAGRPA